ncbi:ABC transporter ATP-binding protein [Mesorhizobium sp.]|uniref:ABC transporter ATP-binding protein n=1 Tax=Mesorhizobium sp. TaxID=1871066 RepID=UPI000FE46CC2|nr:ABC transporter ATP-binding protein [Mesorhizobium sp.]RWJ05706.1 MAG: ABC transporter ATP-binding protein [Mesorhizobium sp.]
MNAVLSGMYRVAPRLAVRDRADHLQSAGQPIEYVSICKRYGAAVALKPTNLRIEAGEFFSIIGPSGSGKTTLLGLTAGFVAASEGHIKIGGVSIEGVPPFKRNIGMVFQNYSLFPHKTVGQNIAFPLQMRGIPKRDIATRVENALRLVRLENVANRHPNALSGGQQQRVALARASVYNPSLLVMDEPLSALDKNLREELQYEIKQLHSKLGCTVLYVTHDQAEAASMAERIAIMNAGEIVQLGSARELYRNPRNRFVAAFLGQANLIPVAGLERTASGIAATTPFGERIVSVKGYEGDGDSWICVRPEAIRITASRPEMDNVVKGVVVDTTFMNGVQRHRVNINGGPVVEQFEQIISASYTPAIGTEVYLGWRADDTLIVADG